MLLGRLKSALLCLVLTAVPAKPEKLGAATESASAMTIGSLRVSEFSDVSFEETVQLSVEFEVSIVGTSFISKICKWFG